MKKRIIFAFVLMLLTSVMLISAVNAEGTCTFSLVKEGTAKVYPGDTVILDLNIENNPDLLWAKLNVEYDENSLELLGVETVGSFKDDANFIATLSETDKREGFTKNVLYWDYRQNGSSDVCYTGDGTMAKLTFKVLDSAVSFTETTSTYKTYSVSVSVEDSLDLVDKDEHTVTPVIKQCKLRVSNIFYQSSLNLGGNIGVNFSVKLTDEQLNKASYWVVFKYGTEDEQVTRTTNDIEYESTYNYRYYACDVYATQMTQSITAELYRNGYIIAKTSMSVLKYAKTLLNTSAYRDYYDLINAMLNYGTYAQLAFDYDVENLPSVPASMSVTAQDLLDTDKDYARTSPKASRNGNPAFISLKYSFLSADTTTKLMFAFQPLTDVDVEDVAFYCEGVPLDAPVPMEEYFPEYAGKGYYVVSIPVDVLHLGEWIKVIAKYTNSDDEELTYTISDTCMRTCYQYIISYSGTENEGYSNLAKAMYLYYLSAKNSPLNSDS